ncbi:MAG: hypothetical protein C0624_08455 [Desulfuromonas sp.]|nr:MAG: hypothetical protein C0624_08455 [Desulfuromonas sp.]
MIRLTTILLLLPALLLGGCIGTSKSTSFQGPPPPEIGSDTDPEQQLENLPFDSLLARADEHVTKGNFELALIHYNQALVRDPESVKALTGLGNLFWKQGNANSAQKAFAQALEFDAQNIEVLIGIGRTLRVQNALEKSEEYLARAVETAPQNLEALTELAIVYDYRSLYQRAEPIYRQICELDSEKSAPLNNLGFNLLLQTRYADALIPLQKALAKAPQDTQIKNNLAIAYMLSGDESRGMGLFENTVGQAGAWNNLGYVYLTQGEWDDATRAFNKALELDPVFYARAKQNLQRVEELRHQTPSPLPIE